MESPLVGFEAPLQKTKESNPIKMSANEEPMNYGDNSVDVSVYNLREGDRDSENEGDRYASKGEVRLDEISFGSINSVAESAASKLEDNISFGRVGSSEIANSDISEIANSDISELADSNISSEIANNDISKSEVTEETPMPANASLSLTNLSSISDGMSASFGPLSSRATTSNETTTVASTVLRNSFPLSDFKLLTSMTAATSASSNHSIPLNIKVETNASADMRSDYSSQLAAEKTARTLIGSDNAIAETGDERKSLSETLLHSLSEDEAMASESALIFGDLQDWSDDSRHKSTMAGMILRGTAIASK